MTWLCISVLVSSLLFSNGEILNSPSLQSLSSTNVSLPPANPPTLAAALPAVLPVAGTTTIQNALATVPPVPAPLLQPLSENSVVPNSIVSALLPNIQTNPVAEPAAAIPQPAQNNVVPVSTAPQPSCVCGVFLSGQFVKGSNKQPIGNPALLNEQGDKFACNSLGNKQCTNKCLDMLVKHLPNSPTIICGSMDRDCYKERAYLWIQNCNSPWINTNLAAGREYCCKDGVPYKCPLVA